MKRPSFQFYPGDWRKDVELRACTLAARGLWIDLMCVAHDCDPYGHLMLNGKPMTMAQIAGQIGVPAAQVKKLVDELLANGVARKTDEGAIYSKRMVADERVRNARAEGGKAGAEHGAKGASHGKKGGRPPLSEGGGKTPLSGAGEPPKNPPPSSSSSSSSTSSQTEDFKGSQGACDLADDSAFGDEPPPPDAPPPEAEDGDGLPDAKGTAYGLIAKAIKQAGIMPNTGHPMFRTLVDAGADALEFTAFAEKAKTMRDPFGYLLGCVEGEREKAKALAGRIHHGAMPAPAPSPKAAAKAAEVQAWFGTAFQPQPNEDAQHGATPLLG